MNHDALIEHLANEAKKRMQRGFHKDYGNAIHFVCAGSPSLKYEVGQVLGMRSAVKRAVENIKRKEAEEKTKKAKQLTLF
jgi:hypothetical protein